MRVKILGLSMWDAILDFLKSELVQKKLIEIPMEIRLNVGDKFLLSCLVGVNQPWLPKGYKRDLKLTQFT